METKTVKGRGEKFVQWSVESYVKAGWEVVSINRGTMGSVTIVYQRKAHVLTVPLRPDR